MNKKISGMRIILNEQAASVVTEMMTSLKGGASHIQVKSSKLVDWIITEYFNIYFDKDKSRIAEAFFSKKAYLKEYIRKMDDNGDVQELIQILNHSIDPKIKKENKPKKKSLVSHDPTQEKED